MKRKLISIFIILAMLQVMTTQIVTASKQDELQDVKDKVSEATQRKNDIVAEKDDIVNEISNLEDSISEYETELEKLNSEIDELESNIKEKSAQIKELEKDYEKKAQLLEDRLVAIYEEGQITFLDALLSADNVWDYISMSSRVQELAIADNQQMEEVENKRQEVEKAKSSLEEEKTKLDSSKKEAEAKKKQLEAAKSSKESKVSNLTAEQKRLQADIEEYKNEIDRIEEEIRKAAQESNGHYDGNFNGILAWPLSSKDTRYYNNITSYFGNREQPVAGASTNHRAIDIGVPIGTPVYSGEDGYVMTKGYSSVRGYYVMVKHADNLYTFYQHLSSILVSQGQTVSRGQQIAKSGNSGIGSGPHLHFEVRTSPYYGSEVNPLDYTHW